MGNLKNFAKFLGTKQGLILRCGVRYKRLIIWAHVMALFSSKKFYKIFQIFRHIESLDICMEY